MSSAPLRSLAAAAALTAAAALAACEPRGREAPREAVAAEPAAPVAPAMGPETPTEAEAFAREVLALDRFMVEAGRLARRRAQSPEIQTFADDLINHHARTTEQARRVADRLGVTPPPAAEVEPEGRDARALEAMGRAEGEAFDRLFAQEMVRAHERGVALLDGYAQQGDRPELRQVAMVALPPVRSHLERARALRPEGGVGATGQRPAR